MFSIKVKNLLYFCLIFAVGCSTTQNTGQNAPSTSTDELLSYQSEIHTDFLKPRLSAFAADSMEGRETGMEGQKKAAKYLSEQYEQLGLTPIGDNNTYLQKFDLNATINDSVVFETYTSDEEMIDRSVSSRDKTGNYMRSFGGTVPLEGEVIFAGFGVNDVERDVTHLEGENLQGKWVLVFQEIPAVVEGDTLISPNINQQFRFQSIMQQDPAGILLIPSVSPQQFQQAAQNGQDSYGEASGMSLAYLDDQSSSGFSQGYTLVNPEMAAQLLDLEYGSEELLSYRDELIENITEFSAQSTGKVFKQTPYSRDVTIETENVLALFEGADPELKDEVIVLTSHYDHVGIGEPDSTGDRIYNGADDDGSGTIGLLNVAKAFVAAKENNVMPKRSILFLNVTGEEKGLLGSRYYSDHPVIPIEQTIANLNADMIGRVDPENEQRGIEEYVYIIGGKIISSQLDSLLHVANEHSGQVELNDRYNDLNDPNQFYRRSDHWNFGRLGVPFAFFFTGVHEDYHRPGDEVEKIRFEKMAKIIRTMYATSVMLANTDTPPEVDNREFIEKTQE